MCVSKLDWFILIDLVWSHFHFFFRLSGFSFCIASGAKRSSASVFNSMIQLFKKNQISNFSLNLKMGYFGILDIKCIECRGNLGAIF